MITEPKPPSSWTPEIVRDHLAAIIEANDKRYEDRFAASKDAILSALNAQEKAVNAALAASEKAVLVAETNAEKWRDNANEWRGAMTDRESKFAMRLELDALKERIDKQEGGSKGMRDVWGWIAAAIAAAIAIGTFVGKERFTPAPQIYIPTPVPAPTMKGSPP